MFCHKVSAAALFPTLYAKIEGPTEGGREGGEGREQLRALFESALVNDDSPMVRRAAAAALPETIKVSESDSPSLPSSLPPFVPPIMY